MISTTRLRGTARLSIVALAPLVMVSILVAQRPGTVTRTTKPRPSTKGMSVEQRVDALEKRVEELEKTIDEFEIGADTESARDKKLEERLAAIERAQKSGRGGAAEPARPPGDDDQPLTVRAPFVVMDEAGRPLMRVDKSPVSMAARVIIGNPVGARLQMGALGGGATLQMYDESQEQRVVLGASATVTNLVLAKKRFQARVTASETDGNLISLFTGDVVSARMASGTAGYGRMVLSSGSGATMVEAGVADGVGVVRAGPRVGGSPGSLTGLPFAIMGKKGE